MKLKNRKIKMKARIWAFERIVKYQAGVMIENENEIKRLRGLLNSDQNDERSIATEAEQNYKS